MFDLEKRFLKIPANASKPFISTNKPKQLPFSCFVSSNCKLRYLAHHHPQLRGKECSCAEVTCVYVGLLVKYLTKHWLCFKETLKRITG